MAECTLLLYNVHNVVDERCLYELFDHKVKQTLFTGFSTGRLAFVELYDAAYRDAILRQSHAGAILAASLNAKLTQRVLKANARKEAAEEKKKGRKSKKEAQAKPDSLDNADDGITLFELLQNEIASKSGTNAPAGSSVATSQSSLESAMYGAATPEFGPFSNVILNGWRLGICASPVSVSHFTDFGGQMPVRANRKSTEEGEQTEADGSPKRKERRTEAGRPNRANLSSSNNNQAEGTSKPAVMQPTRMRNANQEAPSFSATAPAKSKITFDNDDDEAPTKVSKPEKAVPPAKRAPVQFSDSDDDVPFQKPTPLAKKAVEKVVPDAEDGEKTLNNRDRKKLQAAAKSTGAATSKKFVYSDSDSD